MASARAAVFLLREWLIVDGGIAEGDNYGIVAKVEEPERLDRLILRERLNALTELLLGSHDIKR
ncbi:MAG: hypothetical protein ACLQA5_00050 [Solirubrobacteraceae bacterium]